jgi:hypothetical protein
MKKITTLLLAITSGVAAMAQCSIAANNIYAFTVQGKNYEVIKQKLNWTAAAACAVTRNGSLAEITSQVEQDSVYYFVNQAGITASQTVAPDGGGASYLWLGGNDILSEGAWVWDGDNAGSSIQFWQGKSNGTAVNGAFNNWGNEPDDFNNNQDGLGLAITNWPLGVAGQWNDVSTANQLYFVIEYPISTGINEETNQSTIELYPNPVVDVINISILGSANYIITDLQGRSIQVGVVNGQQVPVAALAKGVYLIQLFDVNQELIHKQKLIKE